MVNCVDWPGGRCGRHVCSLLIASILCTAPCTACSYSYLHIPPDPPRHFCPGMTNRFCVCSAASLNPRSSHPSSFPAAAQQTIPRQPPRTQKTAIGHMRAPGFFPCPSCPRLRSTLTRGWMPRAPQGPRGVEAMTGGLRVCQRSQLARQPAPDQARPFPSLIVNVYVMPLHCKAEPRKSLSFAFFLLRCTT